MDIILRRKVKAETLRLLMDIRKKTKRDDLIAVLMLAQELDEIKPEDICRKLIANRPITVGKRIIQRCVELNLLEYLSENSADLTDLGRSSVDEKAVFTPERGLYEIIYSEDILLPQELLDCHPDERMDANDDKNTYEVESHIRNKLVNRKFQLLGKEREEIFIEKIEPKGRKTNKNININLTYSLLRNGKKILRINGDIDTQLDVPDIDQEEVWNNILTSIYISGSWDSHSQTLTVAFEGLSEKERSTFLKSIEEKGPHIQDLGFFDEVQVKEIPISPATQEDAQKWAYWLLEKEISDYLLPDEYLALTSKITDRFDGYDINMPSQLEFADMIRRKSPDKICPAYWYLKAPISLSEVM